MKSKRPITQFELRLDDRMEIRRNPRPNAKIHGEWIAYITIGGKQEEVKVGSLQALSEEFPAASIRLPKANFGVW